jgi:hypothetical protein
MQPPHQPQQPYAPQGGHWQHAQTMPVGAPQQPAYFQQPMMAAPPPPPKKTGGVVWKVLGGIAAAVVAFLVVGWFLAAPEPKAAPEQSSSEVVSSIPRPDGPQTEELLRGLGQIVGGLEAPRSVDRARNVCMDLLAEQDRAAVVDRARQRFDGSVKVDAAAAEEIVVLIESSSWCRATS